MERRLRLTRGSRRMLASAALLAVLVGGAAGCATAPRVSLSEARLAEGPVLVRRPDGYVLRYRFPPPRDGLRFAASVDARRTEDAGYYYFVGVVQSTALERGALVERPLARDGLDELAARGRVFWLDPDGTTHRIPVL